MSDNDAIVAITANKGIPKDKLDRLSRQTGLPLLKKQIQAEYRLHIGSEHLELQKRITSNPKKQKIESISIDFVAGKSKHRRLQGGGKGQAIAKAVGLHKMNNPKVLDLTAGMGSDGFVLASLGADVMLVERNTVIHALLNDALERAGLVQDTELQQILNRIKLIKADAADYLEQLEEYDLPDVIYLDPMFPQRSKTAQVKKEMQFFHDIVGGDTDSESLLLKALDKAKKRIVVKRPRLAEKLTQQIQPAFQITGKTTRYDIYLSKNLSTNLKD